MNPIIEISLSALAWLIALIRLKTVIVNRIWKSDPIAFRVWMATLFFALTMTFLVTPLGRELNRLAFPNFSRLLAYASVSMTLYLIASSFLVTFPTIQNQRQVKYLKPYLILTLILLFTTYFLLVAHTSEWNEQPIPATSAEMIFKLVIFTYAAVMCAIMAVACYRYLGQEKVAVTKYRIITIILTATGGGAFFFSKTILSLGYLWHALGAEWIHSLSKLLEIGTAILWAGSFLHSNVYMRALAFLRGIRYWFVYQDLVYLVENLEHLCDPVGMAMSKPSFWEFALNSDYYLYRAVVHILDGKTLIADFLKDSTPIIKLRDRWGSNGIQEALRLNAILQSIKPNDDFPEMILAYRAASRKLMGSPA